MMKIEKVKAVLDICEEFKKRAERWFEETKPRPSGWRDEIFTPDAPKESAALKRTSMELTRALADMRRPK